MPDTIRDGRGRGWLAAVNSDQQLITRATAVEQRLASAVDGNYYEATTGVTTLTDAVETPMLYLKNSNTNSDIVFVIDRLFIDVWASTGGSGGGTLEYYKNPAVTGGTDIVPVNSNFAKVGGAAGTFKKALTTMADGAGTHWWWASIQPSGSYTVEEGRIIIPSGYSFGITYEAPASNTNQDISINVAFFELDITLIE